MTSEDRVRKALHRLKTEFNRDIPRELEQILPAIIAEEFDGPDIFVYKGWSCVRIVIENIPKPHRPRIKDTMVDRYGYCCTKGDIVKYLPPESNNDVSMKYAKTRIDFWEEWFEVRGTYEGLNS